MNIYYNLNRNNENKVIVPLFFNTFYFIKKVGYSFEFKFEFSIRFFLLFSFLNRLNLHKTIFFFVVVEIYNKNT